MTLGGCEGAEGPAGPEGNANVITGGTTLTEADWAGTVQHILTVAPNSTVGSRPARYADIAVPEVTSDVVEAGAVLVYLRPSPDEPWQQLPYHFLPAVGSTERRYLSDVTEGQIRILYYAVDLDLPDNNISPLTPEQPDRAFRWMIIPPTAASQLAALPVRDGPDVLLRALADRGFTTR